MKTISLKKTDRSYINDSDGRTENGVTSIIILYKKISTRERVDVKTDLF